MKVVTTLDAEVVSAAGMAAAQAPARPDLRGPATCPGCQKVMAVQKLACGVVIDICDQHGAWFDRDELSQFVGALATQRKKAGIPTGVVVGAAVVGTAAVVGVAALAASSSVANDAADAVNTAAASGVSAGDVVEGAAHIVGGIFELLGALGDLG